MGWSTSQTQQAGNNARPPIQETIVYGNFATDSLALAAKPAGGSAADRTGLYYTESGFWIAPSPWGSIATPPPAGMERYACQAISTLQSGQYSRAFVSDPVQQTNNGRGVQYSDDGVTGWTSTISQTGYFRIWDTLTDLWGPPALIGAMAGGNNTQVVATRSLASFVANNAFIPLDTSTGFTKALYFALQFTYGLANNSRGQAVILTHNVRSIERVGIHSRVPSQTNISNLFVSGFTIQLILTSPFDLSVSVPTLRQGTAAVTSSVYVNLYHETANPGVITRARQFAPDQNNPNNTRSIHGIALGT